MKKAVIYTSLTGGYDHLPQYKVIDPDFDYICFTNDYPAGSKVGQWEIRPIPIKLKDKIRLSRYAKLIPHTVFPDYDYSIWLDANLVITDKSIYETIKYHIASHHLWCAIKHPRFDCLYFDAFTCVYGAKASYNEMAPQIKFLRSENYPEHNGLYENNFIIRRHNDPTIKSIDEQWWEMYLKFSHRDQASLCYIFWKRRFKPVLLFPPDISTRNVKGIEYIKHLRYPLKHRIKVKIRMKYNRFRMHFSNVFDQYLKNK